MSYIDHLGIAVKSLAEARKFYEKLGLQVMPEETVEAEKVRSGDGAGRREPHRAAGADLARLDDCEVSRRSAAKACTTLRCMSTISPARSSA